MIMDSNDIKIINNFFNLDFYAVQEEDGKRVRYDFTNDLNDNFFNSFEICFLITFEGTSVKMEFELGELYKIIVVPNDFKFHIHAINYLKQCIKEAHSIYHDNDNFLQYINSINSKNLYTIKLTDGTEILTQYIGKSHNQESISLYQCIDGNIYTLSESDNSYRSITSHRIIGF